MIGKIAISDPSKTPIKWLEKVSFLSAPREFNFTPGLNILWGKNGSGKSTLLRLLARLFHAEQGRVSTVTQTSVGELFAFSNESRLSGVGVSHDGQGAIFYDPTEKVGLIGGGAGFDADFFAEGVQSIVNKGSSGELVMHNLGLALLPLKKSLESGGYLKPVFKVKKDLVNSLWKGYIETTESFFVPDMEPGLTTVMLDEPDRSLDIPSQKLSWEGLVRFAKLKRAQLIVATHSVFACNIPDANYIEFSPGYLEQCKQAIKGLNA